MDQAPDDQPQLPAGVPRSGPVRVVRAKWSLQTLRETALVRGVMAAVALAAGGSWIWVVLDSVSVPRTVRGVVLLLRGTAFPLVLLGFGLHEAWRALALWREARRRPPRQ